MTIEMVDLGPDLPFHDLAHFVVERHLHVSDGFYGNINKGYTVEQLSNKVVIKSLPVESMASEIITRTLQTLAVGASTVEQFDEMIELEFKNQGIHYPISWNQNDVEQMLLAYRQLIGQWTDLEVGEYLILEFSVNHSSR